MKNIDRQEDNTYSLWKKEWASSHTPCSSIAWECCIQEWQFKALVTGNQKIRKCISTDYVLHNYKVSRYSVKPFQWSCAEELFWVVSFIVVKFLSSKRGITPRKKMESKFPVDIHIYTLCPSLLQSFRKYCWGAYLQELCYTRTDWWVTCIQNQINRNSFEFF